MHLKLLRKCILVLVILAFTHSGKYINAFIQMKGGQNDPPLHWQNSTISYVIHYRGSVDVPGSGEDASVTAAFDTWAGVDNSDLTFIENSDPAKKRLPAGVNNNVNTLVSTAAYGSVLNGFEDAVRWVAADGIIVVGSVTEESSSETKNDPDGIKSLPTYTFLIEKCFLDSENDCNGKIGTRIKISHVVGINHKALQTNSTAQRVATIDMGHQYLLFLRHVEGKENEYSFIPIEHGRREVVRVGREDLVWLSYRDSRFLSEEARRQIENKPNTRTGVDGDFTSGRYEERVDIERLHELIPSAISGKFPLK